MANVDTHAADAYIKPLNMNGLHGRMLMAPAAKAAAKREILLIYGHHALIERWWGLVENLQEFGSVTMPDLPGFGGMDSFVRIGRRPTLDNYADYLAAFIKMRYKKRPITIVGISFGFLVATRMLQKYPELATRVNFLASIVGFMHYDDFLFPPAKRKFLARATATLAARPVAWFIRRALLNRFVIRTIYVRMSGGKRRFIDVEPLYFDTLINFETRLWQENDVTTHWFTTSRFLCVDNCQAQINLPVYHVAASHDHFFNNEIVEQHMRIVFSGYRKEIMQSKAHTPSILGDKAELAVMIPAGLRQALRKQP